MTIAFSNFPKAMRILSGLEQVVRISTVADVRPDSD